MNTLITEDECYFLGQVTEILPTPNLILLIRAPTKNNSTHYSLEFCLAYDFSSV